MPKKPHTIDEAFFASRSIYNESTGCREWSLRRNATGYGQAKHRGRNYMAHRLAWAMVHGPIPEGMIVCHQCDNPSCVNVKHLFLGTTQDNVDDKMHKGRHVVTRGSKSHHARLTEAHVAQILEDKRRQREVAAEYGVTQSTIAFIKSGKTWMHVPRLPRKEMTVREFAAILGVSFDRFRHQFARHKRGARYAAQFCGVNI